MQWVFQKRIQYIFEKNLVFIDNIWIVGILHTNLLSELSAFLHIFSECWIFCMLPFGLLDILHAYTENLFILGTLGYFDTKKWIKSWQFQNQKCAQYRNYSALFTLSSQDRNFGVFVHFFCSKLSKFMGFVLIFRLCLYLWPKWWHISYYSWRIISHVFICYVLVSVSKTVQRAKKNLVFFKQ